MAEYRISSYPEQQQQKPGQISCGVQRMSGEIIWLSCDRDCQLIEIISYLVKYHLHDEGNDMYYIHDIMLLLDFEAGPLDTRLCLIDIIDQLEKHNFMFDIIIQCQ